jgi:hypothetical protein
MISSKECRYFIVVVVVASVIFGTVDVHTRRDMMKRQERFLAYEETESSFIHCS